MRAWELVKANKGTAGVDGETIEQFGSDLRNKLYRLWNRMSSGSYFPPAVKTVAIPKATGGERKLGIPTVSDRIAQMVVKLSFEPLVEPYFHADSYGYRPNKSAHQAVDVTRKRCWRYDWVLEFDIRGLFDNIDHGLLMKAVRKHTNNRWLLLYIERWLKAPIQLKDGTMVERTRGVPQGGVISPVLSNLFLHYAFDMWMERSLPGRPFCRYADDALVHCRSYEEAEKIRIELGERLQDCGLELHPGKTKIVYCKDSDRREDHPVTSFDFLGYTFRPRRSKTRWGKVFTNFCPAMSDRAGKAIRQEVKRWRLHLRSDKSLCDLAQIYRAQIQGWINYYGRFYKSSLQDTLRIINSRLTRWLMRKYKKLKRRQKKAEDRLRNIASRYPNLFMHWKFDVRP